MATFRPLSNRWLSCQLINSGRSLTRHARSLATAISTPTAPIAVELHKLSHNLPSDTTRRKEIYDAARELMYRTENRKDALHRITDAHELNNVAQVGVDLNIFRTLAATPDSILHIKEIASDSKADNTLLIRILRFLASNGMIEQVTENGFKASNLTMQLATDDAEHTIRMNTLIFQPMMNKLPAFLKSTGYQNPDDCSKTLFGHHYQTELPLFDWLRTHPEELEVLHHVIGKMRVGQKTWTDVLPLDTIKLSEHDVKSDRILFVDVGGGTGHQSIAVREKRPDLLGRIVLQDLPQVTGLVEEEKLQSLDIETLSHDFFTAQPPAMQGAKVYFIRNALHDWPDDKCVDILHHLRNAMAKDSVIMIDEIVLPDVGANTRPMHYDIMLMGLCAGVERSEKHWHQLLAKAGLKVREIYSLHQETHDCVIVAEAA